MAAVLQFYSQFWQVRTWVLAYLLGHHLCHLFCHIALAHVSLVQRRRKSWPIIVSYMALSTELAEEPKTQRHENYATTKQALKEKDMMKENFHDTKKDQRCPEENSTMKRTRDTTTRRHGTDATKTTDNNSKNNFRILSLIWRHILPGTSNNSIAYWYLSL